MKYPADYLAKFWGQMDYIREVIEDTAEEDEEAAEAFGTAAEDIKARKLSDDVLDEAEECLDRDWCSGVTRASFLKVLADAGRLPRYNPNTITFGRRKPKPIEIDGIQYLP
jgi:acetyl-CoA carboxylase alpha subunit